jgi:hypothetical protein
MIESGVAIILLEITVLQKMTFHIDAAILLKAKNQKVTEYMH